MILAQTMTALVPPEMRTGNAQIDAWIAYVFALVSALGVIGTIIKSIKANGLMGSLSNAVVGIEMASREEVVDVLKKHGIRPADAELLAKRIHEAVVERIRYESKVTELEYVMKPVVRATKQKLGIVDEEGNPVKP